MSREAMQMALEALELYQSKSSVQMFDIAVRALRQALETKQERAIEQALKEKNHG